MRPYQQTIMDRRDFLRLLSGGVLTAAAAGLAGCGGGGSSSGGNGGGGNGGGSGGGDPRALSESLVAIQDYVNSVGNQPRAARLQQIAAFLSTRKELAVTGTNDSGVWAVYPDGSPLMILDNRTPDQLAPELRAVPAITRGVEVPKSMNARLINAMGNAFANETPIVRPFLDGNGYAVTSDAGTVSSLKGVSGDGVFYMSSHGGTCGIPLFTSTGALQRDPAGRPLVAASYGIWTTSRVDPANPSEFIADVQAARLGYGVALANVVGGVNQNELHYFITPFFVSKYMSFDVNSLVWLSACLSNSRDSIDFVNACLAKGAGLYVGWTNTTTSSACVVAGRFILDRLIGSNTSNPKETPPQRPFDYEEVWGELHEKGLDVHPSDGKTTKIVYTSWATSDFGLLAPTIGCVVVDEKNDQAILKGTFGTPAEDERVVMIGGIEASVVSWDKNKIVCALPRTGTGSSGDVVVIVRAHKSNVRRITEWNLHLRYKWVLPGMSELKVDGAFHIRFRADVGDYREQAGAETKKPVRYAFPTADSSGIMDASGLAPDGDGTIEWGGRINLESAWLQPKPAHELITAMMVDTASKQGAIGLAFGGTAPWFTQTVTSPRGTQVTNFAPFQSVFGGQQNFPDPADQTSIVLPVPGMPVTFGEDFSLPSGKFVDINLGLTYDWDAVTPLSPPDPQAARAGRTKHRRK